MVGSVDQEVKGAEVRAALGRVRGTIVVGSASLMSVFAARAAQGSKGAFRRLRVLSAVMVVIIAVRGVPRLDDARPGGQRPGAARPGLGCQRQAPSVGSTNRESAAKLFISEATVKSHLLNIYSKLDVNDRAAAVAEAFQRGLLRPDRL